MKIAVSGKGGVGKTTLSAFLVKRFAAENRNVLAIDADPDANLAHGLGMANGAEIVPISRMKDLVSERTESTPGGFGGFFKLNPRVDDLPEKLAVPGGPHIRLMVMGGVKKGGMGCVCPESVLLKNLVQHLILYRDDVVIMDMEAGIEHLGRGTARAVDCLIIVVEPGSRSVETARKIRDLGGDIGLKRLALVGNKVRGAKDREFLMASLPGMFFCGFIPYDEGILESDLKGVFAEEVAPGTRAAFEDIFRNLTDLVAEELPRERTIEEA